MTTTQKGITKMAEIILKYLDQRTARKMVRELYYRVEGSQSLMKTLLNVYHELEEIDDRISNKGKD